MAEARRAGGAIAASEPRIDVLINNAGALFADRRVTSEGLELTFALNHMAYFVLTRTLREKLVASAPRVVSTSSMAHQGMSLDFSDLQSARRYNGWQAYGRSKLANILFTRELARRLAAAGRPTRSIPASSPPASARPQAGLLLPLARQFFSSPKEGADTLVYLATSPEVANVTGEYFAKRNIAWPSSAARDDTATKKLWEASEALAGTSW